MTRAQFDEAGLSKRFLQCRLSSGAWRRVCHGVFKCSPAPFTQLEKETAALLACGPNAALSHQSAAALWELSIKPARNVVVSIPEDRRVRSSDFIETHRLVDPLPHDIRVHRGRRVTSVTRTTLDLAAVLPPEMLRIIVEAALRRRDCPRDWLARLERRAKNRKGAENLRHVLAPYAVIDGAGESPLESMMMEIVAFMPGKCFRNYPVMGELDVIAHVDYAWPEVRLAMESDGFAFHADRDTFVKDRRKQNLVQDYGWLLYRFTHTQAVNEADACRNQMVDAYQRRAAAMGVPFPK